MELQQHQRSGNGEQTPAHNNDKVLTRPATGPDVSAGRFKYNFVNNNGTVNVTADALTLNRPFTQGATGIYNIAAGATLSTSAQSFTNGAINGSGTVDLGGATLINNGTVRPGQPGR